MKTFKKLFFGIVKASAIFAIAYIFLILLNHLLPLYPNQPDLEGFYKTEKISLIIPSTDNQTESKITIKTTINEKTLPITNESIRENITNLPATIDFSSTSWTQKTYIYITLPKGKIVTISPQSAIFIGITGEINLIQGKIMIYTWWSIQEETEMISRLIQEYTLRRNDYLTDQIGGKILLNSTVDTFIWRYLNLANSFTSYDQNILNYNEFHTYLPYQKTNTDQYINTTSPETILNETQKWYETTMTNWRINNITETLNKRFWQ